MNWYFKVLKRYADFNGRARRKEYWLFVLFHILICLVLGVVDGVLGLDNKNSIISLAGLYSLAIFIPSIAVAVRRLHDTNRSGWWLLLSLIPCVGGIVLLIFFVEDGQFGENEYGSNPKTDMF